MHAEWDRNKRTWQATLAMSTACHRTNETAMHQELAELIGTGDAVDTKLVNFEQRMKTKQATTLVDLSLAKTWVTEITKVKKDANFRNNGLLSWIRMPVDSGAKS